MSRHRDIRNMDYSDDYDGYDDIYGHSIDDDYCISPSNRQFLYNRENSAKSVGDGIKEEDEVEAELKDSEKLKLESCIDEIHNVLGTVNIPRNNLVDLILAHKFDKEKIVDGILEDPRYKESEGTERKEKGVRMQPNKFTIPKLNIKNINRYTSANECCTPKSFEPNTNLSGSRSFTTNDLKVKQFVIPKVFGKNLTTNVCKNKNFTIPKLTSNDSKPNFNKLSSDMVDSTQNSSDEFNSLSELVSSHLNKVPVAYEMDFIKTKQNHIEIDKELNRNVKNIAKLKLSDTKSMSSIENKSPIINGWHIDLSVALKSTNSIPSITSSRRSQNLEKFKIPFVDCEEQKILTRNKKLLPCKLDVSDILKISARYQKRVSNFGRALCLRYKRPKPVIKRLCDHVNVGNIKRFNFNIPSPDDIISSHLRR